MSRIPRGPIRELIAGRRRRLVLLGVSSFLGGVTEAAFLILITRAGLSVTQGEGSFDLFGDEQMTVRAALMVCLLLSLVRVSLAAWGSWQSARLMTDVVAENRRDLAQAYLRASWTTQEHESVGQLQELLTGFTQRGSDLVQGLTLVISSTCSLVALLALAIAIDPPGALMVIVSVLLLGSVLRPLRTAIRRRSSKFVDTSMEFATSLGEVAQLGLEMHVFNVQEQTLDRVDHDINRIAEADRRLTFVRMVLPQIYTGVAYLALVVALSVVRVSGATNLESLGAVMLMMLRSLSYGQQIQSSSASVVSNVPFLQALQERLAHFQGHQLRDGGVPIGSIGTLALEDVSYEYEPERPVLRGLTAEIDPRQVVGVVGPSGSGKSTLVQLLLGLRSPISGRIVADGRPIETLSRGEWARKITIVSQTSHLITGTVADNIRFFRDDVTHDDVVRAARLAHIDDEIQRHPHGYQRALGPGAALSGGQLQRLCIARALVERPDVLILDEPTSALDAKSEQLVRDTLAGLRHEMTILIVAHRLSTLEICDRIMVIQDGTLMGYDTPSNLAISSDFYHEAIALSGMK